MIDDDRKDRELSNPNRREDINGSVGNDEHSFQADSVGRRTSESKDRADHKDKTDIASRWISI